MEKILSSRDKDILEILISDYISTAMPVGSRTISKKYRGSYSAATIRSILADLEDMGLLLQPHTSAGRIPTTQGLRFYVDSMLKCRDLSDQEKDDLYKHFLNKGDVNVDEVIVRTSKTLSAISNYIGLVSTSGRNHIVFKQIQFIPLSSNRLLGVFVSQEGFVQNKIIEITDQYSYSDLEKINNYCNSAFLGLTLEDARTKITAELFKIEADYDRLLGNALIFSREVFNTIDGGELVFDGESHLVGEPEFSDTEKLRALLEMLEEKKQLLYILDKCRESEGVRIFIGAEVGVPNVAAQSVSVVTAPFKKGGRILGTLGVIGPVRMDYSRVVPIVDFTAKMLGDILN